MRMRYIGGEWPLVLRSDGHGLALWHYTISPGPAVTVPALVGTASLPSRTIMTLSTAIVSVRLFLGP